MHNNLAIIPARGGSKRIPRKNIKSFLGKPIIAYSIEAALNCGLFSELIVSTDDKEIADVARSYGATVPFVRSAENSDDYATTVAVLNEVIEKYKSRDKIFNYVCCIYPTAPFVTGDDLKKGFERLISNDLASVFPVVAFSYPILRGLKLDENNKPEMIWPEHKNARSQDLTKAYHDAGQWYWFDPLKITDTLFTSHSQTIILPEEQVQDIDQLSDWKIAEMKYKIINEA